MNWVYVVTGLLSLGIFIYLIAALLYPEKF
jgi:K+-transporting ATPase KdpF subunit